MLCESSAWAGFYGYFDFPKDTYQHHSDDRRLRKYGVMALHFIVACRYSPNNIIVKIRKLAYPMTREREGELRDILEIRSSALSFMGTKIWTLF